ncbi:MAG TPA: D-alanyl-D-alanine carboxypeptidase family protein [Solirubrobacteraceae bacterium]|nr:D-alanyl-D-alanine carboxypeptidase family protein [Solirubrobacteraceae bacterium]
MRRAAVRWAVGAACALWMIMAAAGPQAAVASGPPQLSVRAAVLVEQSTWRRLDAINADEPLPIASTTKLMTALITLEHVHHLSTTFTQNDYYAAAVDSQIGLVPGERMSVHDLLLALMLPSADDAAEDLAFNVGHGSVGRFVSMMNARARALGLTHTHYSTPIGLDTPGNYSSAADLVKLAGYVLTHSSYFARIVALPRAVLYTGNHTRVILNRNTLVGRVPWINGVKTGHTSGAGYVLVASGTRNGMTLLSAVLGTSSEASRDASTLALLNYGFDNFSLRTPVRAGTVLARPAVKDRPGVRADVIAAATYTRVLPRRAKVRLRVEAPKQLAGPLKARTVVGRVVVIANGRPIARIRLLLAHPLAAVSPLTLASRFLTRPSTLVSVFALLGLIVALAVVWRSRMRGREPDRPNAA